MKTLPSITAVEYEMLLAIARAQRKQPRQAITDWIRQTYMAL
tara:strand:- start:5236 stop:5361 length:126 start_codon:yes stop_codon:yes gene_type:complete